MAVSSVTVSAVRDFSYTTATLADYSTALAPQRPFDNHFELPLSIHFTGSANSRHVCFRSALNSSIYPGV